MDIVYTVKPLGTKTTIAASLYTTFENVFPRISTKREKHFREMVEKTHKEIIVPKYISADTYYKFIITIRKIG
jgi:archaellum component FlaF (FlaF/FlaG flagellin family)